VEGEKGKKKKLALSGLPHHILTHGTAQERPEEKEGQADRISSFKRS